MRTLVMGSGAVGAYFGGKLALYREVFRRERLATQASVVSGK